MTAAPHYTETREHGPGSALRRVEAALEARGCKRKAKLWTCPSHPDGTASLSVTDTRGYVRLHCFGPCEGDAVRLALGLEIAELYDEPKTQGRANSGAAHGARSSSRPGGAHQPDAARPHEVEVIGPPTPEQVACLARDLRITTPDTLERVGAKHVRARFYDPERESWGAWGEWLGFEDLAGGWRLWKADTSGRLVSVKAGPGSIMLSPDLRQRNGGRLVRVFDVEGESDWLACVDQEMVGVLCGTGGALSLAGHDRHAELIRSLEPAEVAIVRDLDDAGRKGAAKAAEWWLAQGILVRVLELPGELGPGGDVRDFLIGRPARDGKPAQPPLGGVAELDGLADSAELLEPTSAATDAGLPLEAVSFSGDRLLALLSREAPLPVEAARPVPGHFSTLIAPPMVGKTTLALWNSMARAAGVAPWPGVEARAAGCVLFYSIDEAPEQVVRRMRGLSILHPAGRLEGYAERLVVAGPDRELDPAALEALRFNEDGLATLERWLSEAEAAGDPFVELYVDAYADVIPLGVSENDNGEATRIGGALERLAVRHGCAIVLLHHTGKPPKAENGDALPDIRYLGRGASALAAKARAVTSLELVGGLPYMRRVRSATNLGPTPRDRLFEVCSAETAGDELLYFRPAADPNQRDPRELLSPGESCSTNELARRLAGDSLADDAEPPGDLKKAAASMREAWRAAGKVTVVIGKRGAKMISLVETEASKSA